MPEVGYLTHITDDIVQVQMPLPFALRIVNCYLIQGASGWTIIDTGINIPSACQRWLDTFKTLNIQPIDIQQIIITHMHPDHFGLAGWLNSLVDHSIPTYHPIGEQRQRQVFDDNNVDNFEQYLLCCGLEPKMAHDVAVGLDSTRNMTLPHITHYQYLHPNQSVQIGNRTFQTILASGHSDGQLMLYHADDELMLSGDHILMKITPNIGLWSQSTIKNPLGSYLQTLEDFQAYKVRLALPGHKWLIDDWQGRLEELVVHHQARLNLCLESLEQGKQTIYDVACDLFPTERFTLHEWRFAVAETYAHLEHLRFEGKVARTADHPVVRFRLS